MVTATEEIEVTTEELSYIAGFFDGEGDVGIIYTKSSGWGYYQMRVHVTNTDGIVPNRLKELFGGSISVRARCNPLHKVPYVWSASGNIASQFLYAIQPYLRQKWEHAEVALEFQRSQKNGSSSGCPINQRYTPEEVSYREFLYGEIRRLNRKGNNGNSD